MKSISFVIPVYNEAKRLSKTFKALNELRLPRGPALSGVEGLKLKEVIFVNDGSTDRTKLEIVNCKLEIEKKLDAKVKIISYKVNKGKGNAIRQGMLASSSDYTLFFDADISTPLSELEKFVPFIKKGIDVIVGTRKNGESTVIKHQPRYRELLGQGFTSLTRFVLQLDVTDFTCGFKAFSKRAKDTIFQKAKINGWGYDAEILFLAKKYNFSIVEKAVLWSNDKDTKVKLYKAVPQTLYDLIAISWYHRGKQLSPILAKIKLSINLPN